jgi:DNA-binding NarL/FixJ family response regulator
MPAGEEHVMTHNEARLLAFESWMDAALRGGDWLVPLGCSAKVLGARTALIIWRDAGRLTAESSSPDAAPAFVRLCRELEGAQGSVLECELSGLGRVAWMRVQPETDLSAGELAFFALFDGAADLELLREIAAVAATSIAVRVRLDAARETSALKMAAFDQLPFGVVIVDKEIHIAERNEACRSLLARSDGLSALNDKLLCRERHDQTALYTAVNRALAGDLTAGIVKVHRAGCAQPYVVRVVAPQADAGARDHCLLMIVDPDDAPSPGSEIWRAMFDLTECELIIAEGLVSGQRINDIANQRGVSIETVRTQTKRMFERLNVSSQAEAAARLSRTAPFRFLTAPA